MALAVTLGSPSSVEVPQGHEIELPLGGNGNERLLDQKL
jgi:hypothetical protein